MECHKLLKLYITNKGECKTCMDCGSGLDYGLDHGLDYGLDHGLDYGLFPRKKIELPMLVFFF